MKKSNVLIPHFLAKDPYYREQVERALLNCGKHLEDRVLIGKRSKEGNVRVEVDGEKFDSKLEARKCFELRTQYGRQRVIRQVSIPIGRKRIRPDFLIIHHINGTKFVCEFVDAKGHETETSKAKRNHLEDAYGLKVVLLKERG